MLDSGVDVLLWMLRTGVVAGSHQFRKCSPDQRAGARYRVLACGVCSIYLCRFVIGVMFGSFSLFVRGVWPRRFGDDFVRIMD